MDNIGVAVSTSISTAGKSFSTDVDAAGGKGTHKRMRFRGGASCGNGGVGERERKPTFRESLGNSVGISGDCERERERLPSVSVCISGQGDSELVCTQCPGVRRLRALAFKRLAWFRKQHSPQASHVFPSL